jgi:uncharacterized membrane protein YphA (DoxX/SURF4 family)
LFVYASVSKLLDFENFQIQLGQSPLLSAFAGWVSWGVPIVELVIALLLLVPKFRLVGLFAAFSLMVMFTTYIIIILNFSSFIPCSCGGILEKMGWTEHLLFNIGFVILALIGILLQKNLQLSNFKILLSILLIGFLCSIIVIVLFFLSEEQIHSNNSFLRRYPHHPITAIKGIPIQYNSYYVAGFSKGKIYLGNSTAPLHLLGIDTSLSSQKQIHIVITDSKNYIFSSIKVSVCDSVFYTSDGSVPVIFKGKIADWNANLQWNGAITFSHYQLIDSLNLVFRSNYNIKGESILGTLYFGSSPKTNFNANLLQKQIDGIFDVDGYLHFDKALNRLVYIYLYRNQFIVADQALNINYRGKTIDTISKSQIKVVDVTSRKERKLAAPPLLVNKSSAVSNNLLFVNSALIGQYEPLEMWEEASIIDVYNLNTNTYVGSFYIYDYDDEKLKNFFVLDNNFYGFIGSHLVQYKLNKGLLSTNVNND